MEMHEGNFLDDKEKNAIVNFLNTVRKQKSKWSPYYKFSKFKTCVNNIKDWGLGEKQFHILLSKYETDIRTGEVSPEDIFLESLFRTAKKNPTTKEYLTSIKEKLKPGKRLRGKDYMDYKALHDALTSLHENNKAYPQMTFLPIEKSYRLEKYSDEKKDSIDYMRQWLQIPSAINSKDNELLYELNKVIVTNIIFFKTALNFHAKKLLEQKNDSRIKRWFVDVFGEYSTRFLPDWEKWRRHSHNKPDFKKSFELFIKFINGSTSKDLGYTSQTYHHFLNDHKPQGIIFLLFKIYSLVFYPIDTEWIAKKRVANYIRKELDTLPYDHRRELLVQLNEEIPDYKLLATYAPKRKYLKDPLF